MAKTKRSSTLVGAGVARLDATLAGLLLAASWLGALLLFASMALLCFDVASRNLFNRPLAGAIGYTEVALVGFVFATLGYTQRRGGHVAVEYFLGKLPGRLANVMHTIGMLIALIAVAWMTWASARVALASVRSGESRISLVAIPAWPARILVAVGFGLLALQLTASIRSVYRDGDR